MSTEPKLNVAIIGYGLAGAVFHAPLIAATPGLRVAAVVTRDQERKRAAAEAFPDARLISATNEVWENAGDYALVVVASPNRFRERPVPEDAGHLAGPTTCSSDLARARNAGRYV